MRLGGAMDRRQPPVAGSQTATRCRLCDGKNDGVSNLSSARSASPQGRLVIRSFSQPAGSRGIADSHSLPAPRWKERRGGQLVIRPFSQPARGNFPPLVQPARRIPVAIVFATEKASAKGLGRRPPRCSPVWAERTTRNPGPHCRQTRSRLCIERLARRGSSVRSAAIPHQSACSDKSGLGGGLPLNPPRRATRGRPRSKLARPGLLEHAAEYAHRLHPIRSIQPQPRGSEPGCPGIAPHLF